MSKVLDSEFEVSEFDLQSCYCIYFWTNPFCKDMNPLIPPSYGLNSTTVSFQQRWLWHYITLVVWYAIKKKEIRRFWCNIWEQPVFNFFAWCQPKTIQMILLSQKKKKKKKKKLILRKVNRIWKMNQFFPTELLKQILNQLTQNKLWQILRGQVVQGPFFNYWNISNPFQLA